MPGYYPEQNNWKKKYELTIPILLFILVAVILAWKVGWLAQIPGLGGLLGGPQVTSILIVGNDKQISQTIQGVKVGKSIKTESLSLKEVNDIRDPSYLNEYDLVILTEELGENPGDLPGLFRDYLSQSFSGGTDLILYGVAGSKDPQNPNVNGWVQHNIGKYIPVTCPNTGACTASKTNHSVKITNLKMQDMDHPIVKGFGTKTNFTGDRLTYKKVNPRSESTTIANIEVETESGTTATPGIVEKSYGLGGKSVYFAYHPSRTPIIFKNTIEYVTG